MATTPPAATASPHDEKPTSDHTTEDSNARPIDLPSGHHVRSTSRDRERRRRHRSRSRDGKHSHSHRRRSRSPRDDKDRHHRRHRSRSPREDRDKDRRRHRSRDDKDRDRRHRHRSRSRDRDHDRKKRSRDDDADSRAHRPRKSSRRSLSPAVETEALPRSEVPPAAETSTAPVESAPPVQRDAWMLEPTADFIDYTQRGAKAPEASKHAAATAKDYAPVVHRNELNTQLGKPVEEYEAEKSVGYTFGDNGSKWRLTKLKRVYQTAKEENRSVEDVALERYGDLKLFDEAREEEIEMSRRERYGTDRKDFKDRPTGDLYRERMEKVAREQEDRAKERARWEPSEPAAPPSVDQPKVYDQTQLNRMRAALMKAQLRGDPKAGDMEREYNAAVAASRSAPQSEVVLTAMHNRQLAGLDSRPVVKEKGRLVESADMSLDDMVREERRTKGVTAGQTFAERISRDAKFSADLDYMDENAAKLASRIQKNEIDIKNMAIAEFKKMQHALDTCPLCEQDGRAPVAPVVSLATRTYLTLPTEPEVAKGGAVIVPLAHKTNMLECDDDEWEEVRNWMKSLVRHYDAQDRGVLFYENAASPQRRKHAAIHAVPLPRDVAEQAPAFFREAILAADEEWAQHKKLIDTRNKGRNGFRRSLAKEMPYFHVWFEIDGGFGHIVEDEKRWPRGDLFAREVVGGMVGVERDVWGKEGRWGPGDKKRVEGFRKDWEKWDWSKVLLG